MKSMFGNNEVRVAVVGRNLDDLRPMLADFPQLCLVDTAPDLVISYGGDGALLGAERAYPLVPKLPLRDVRQNPKCPLHSERDVLANLVKGKLEKTELRRLKVITPAGKSVIGINDVVIASPSSMSAIRYRIDLSGKVLRPQVVADSLIISTPFGSTGYYQSITHGSFLAGIGLAFNNALDFYSHCIVPESAVLDIALLRGPAVLHIDNNPDIIKLKTGDTVRVLLDSESTLAFGVDIFRCLECYHLRKNGQSLHI